jgi:uncharacterized lipoprotein
MSGITQEPQMNSNTRAIRPLLLVGVASLAIVMASSGCSWIRNKTHYQASKEANPLEVPPDMDKPDTSAATSLPPVGSMSTPQSQGAMAGHLAVSAAEAYPKIGDILAATPGVTLNGKAEALSSYDVTYKGESFLLRVIDATGGSRLVALSPDGRMLNSGSAAELMAAIKSKF